MTYPAFYSHFSGSFWSLGCRKWLSVAVLWETARKWGLSHNWLWRQVTVTAVLSDIYLKFWFRPRFLTLLLLLWRILNGRGLPNCLTELPSLKCLSSSLHSRDSHPFANVLRPSPSGSLSAFPTLTCALQEEFFQCVMPFNVAKVW